VRLIVTYGYMLSGTGSNAYVLVDLIGEKG